MKSLQEAYPGVAAIVETDLNLAQVNCPQLCEFPCHAFRKILVRVLTLLHMDLDLDWTELQAGGNEYF